MRNNTRSVRFVVIAVVLILSAASVLTAPAQAADKTREVNIGGYLMVAQSQAPATFNVGYSFYTAAWPLVEKYQGHRFQSGLYGTWMHPQYEGPAAKELYSDIEGGLGWWTDTRFPTETPKFIMGGLAPNFSDGGAGWKIWPPKKGEEPVPLAWKTFATPFTPDPLTFGYRWNDQLTRTKIADGSLVKLPEYFHLTTNANRKQPPFPHLRSGHQLLQRPSLQKQIPSSGPEATKRRCQGTAQGQ